MKPEQGWEIRRKVRQYMEAEGMLASGAEEAAAEASLRPVIAAAVSGGADSVCLLRILHALQKEAAFSLHCIHVHHGIRTDTADRDADFVAALCETLGVPFSLRRVDAPSFAKQHGRSLEDAARLLRYEALTGAAPAGARIATAHHRDDNAETVLFHLLRGTGLRGLTGIHPVRGQIIRPLLCLSRGEIEAYLALEQQPFMTDETNTDNAYTRNYIRNVLLPAVHTVINPKAAAHIADTAARLREAEAYLDERTREAYADCLLRGGDGSSTAAVALSLTKLRALPAFLQKEVLLFAFADTAGSRNNLSDVHLQALCALTHSTEGGKTLHLPQGVTVMKSGRRIQFRKEENASRDGNDGNGPPI